MNQEILMRLEKQAEKLVLDIPAPLDCDEYTLLFNEKFAELIVRECMAIASEEEGHSPFEGPVETKIKQHFGLELKND